jgi:hypothetical protein
MQEGIELPGRRGRRRKQVLDNFKEKKRYWKEKVEPKIKIKPKIIDNKV